MGCTCTTSQLLPTKVVPLLPDPNPKLWLRQSSFRPARFKRSQSISCLRVPTTAEFVINRRLSAAPVRTCASPEAGIPTLEEAEAALQQAEYPLFLLETAYRTLAQALQDFAASTATPEQPLELATVVLLGLVTIELKGNPSSLRLELSHVFPYLFFKDAAVAYYRSVVTCWSQLVTATARIESFLPQLAQHSAAAVSLVADQESEKAAYIKSAPQILKNIQELVHSTKQSLYRLSTRLQNTRFYYALQRIGQEATGTPHPEQFVLVYRSELQSYLN